MLTTSREDYSRLYDELLRQPFQHSMEKVKLEKFWNPFPTIAYAKSYRSRADGREKVNFLPVVAFEDGVGVVIISRYSSKLFAKVTDEAVTSLYGDFFEYIALHEFETQLESHKTHFKAIEADIDIFTQDNFLAPELP